MIIPRYHLHLPPAPPPPLAAPPDGADSSPEAPAAVFPELGNVGSSCCRGGSHLSAPTRESPPGSFPSSRFHRERRGFGTASVPAPGPAGGNQLRLLLTAWENIPGSSSPERPEIQAAAAPVAPSILLLLLFHPPFLTPTSRPSWKIQSLSLLSLGTAGHSRSPIPSHPIPGARLIPRLLSLKTNLFPPQHVILGTVIPTIPRYSLKLHPHFPASCLLKEYFSVLFQLPDTETAGGTSQSTMSSSHALTLQLGSC